MSSQNCGRHPSSDHEAEYTSDDATSDLNLVPNRRRTIRVQAVNDIDSSSSSASSDIDVVPRIDPPRRRQSIRLQRLRVRDSSSSATESGSDDDEDEDVASEASGANNINEIEDASASDAEDDENEDVASDASGANNIDEIEDSSSSDGSSDNNVAQESRSNRAASGVQALEEIGKNSAEGANDTQVEDSSSSDPASGNKVAPEPPSPRAASGLQGSEDLCDSAANGADEIQLASEMQLVRHSDGCKDNPSGAVQAIQELVEFFDHDIQSVDEGAVEAVWPARPRRRVTWAIPEVEAHPTHALQIPEGDSYTITHGVDEMEVPARPSIPMVRSGHAEETGSDSRAEQVEHVADDNLTARPSTPSSTIGELQYPSEAPATPLHIDVGQTQELGEEPVNTGAVEGSLDGASEESGADHDEEEQQVVDRISELQRTVEEKRAEQLEHANEAELWTRPLDAMMEDGNVKEVSEVQAKATEWLIMSRLAKAAAWIADRERKQLKKRLVQLRGGRKRSSPTGEGERPAKMRRLE